MYLMEAAVGGRRCLMGAGDVYYTTLWLETLGSASSWQQWCIIIILFCFYFLLLTATWGREGFIGSMCCLFHLHCCITVKYFFIVCCNTVFPFTIHLEKLLLFIVSRCNHVSLNLLSPESLNHYKQFTANAKCLYEHICKTSTVFSI